MSLTLTLPDPYKLSNRSVLRVIVPYDSLNRIGNPLVAVQGDVRKAEDVVRWVKETTDTFGRLDILVNCAAGNFLANPPPPPPSFLAN